MKTEMMKDYMEIKMEVDLTTKDKKIWKTQLVEIERNLLR